MTSAFLEATSDKMRVSASDGRHFVMAEPHLVQTAGSLSLNSPVMQQLSGVLAALQTGLFPVSPLFAFLFNQLTCDKNSQFHLLLVSVMGKHIPERTSET